MLAQQSWMVGTSMLASGSSEIAQESLDKLKAQCDEFERTLNLIDDAVTERLARRDGESTRIIHPSASND